MDIPVDAMKALKTLEARLKDPHPVVQMVSVKAQVEAVKMVVAKEIAPLVSRLDTIEIKTLIPIERGERGRDGVDGRNGRDGAPGRDGIDGVGTPGRDGAPGKTGKSGKHGVSVIDAEIAADDHLVLKLSDGEIIDAGELPGVDSSRIQHIISSQLPNNQVYVSATAPSNPSINDLWYDIS